MLKAATVTWVNKFSLRNGERLGRQLVEELGSLPDACWLFCARREGLQSFLKGVAKAVETPYLIGCTTDGEIAADGFHQESAVLAGLVAPQMDFHLCWEENLGADSEDTGRRLARQLPGGLRYVQLFSDGLTGNGCALLRGMQNELGPTLPISGGTAADGERFQRTYQFADSRLLTNAAVALGFSGDFHLGLGVNSGWSPVGIGKKVTRASGHILYELDGEPALEVYRRFLGKHAEQLPAVGVEYPLALMDGASLCAHQDLEYPYLLRATMAVNPEEGSIQFAGEIPQGALVYLTCGDSQSLLEAIRGCGAPGSGRAERSQAGIGLRLLLHGPAYPPGPSHERRGPAHSPGVGAGTPRGILHLRGIQPGAAGHPQCAAQRNRHCINYRVTEMSERVSRHQQVIALQEMLSLSERKTDILTNLLKEASTEFERALERVKVSEANFRTIFENAPEAIFILDQHSHHILDSNPFTIAWLGYARNELVGMNYENLLESQDPDLAGSIRALHSQGGVKIIDRRFRKKDGTLVDAEVTGTIITYHGREP